MVSNVLFLHKVMGMIEKIWCCFLSVNLYWYYMIKYLHKFTDKKQHHIFKIQFEFICVCAKCQACTMSLFSKFTIVTFGLGVEDFEHIKMFLTGCVAFWLKSLIMVVSCRNTYGIAIHSASLLTVEGVVYSFIFELKFNFQNFQAWSSRGPHHDEVLRRNPPLVVYVLRCHHTFRRPWESSNLAGHRQQTIRQNAAAFGRVSFMYSW